VLHIGKADPWDSYAPIEMGQWPAALTLPAFANRPTGAGDATYLSSRDFADNSAKEWSHLAGLHPFFALNAHVTAITPGHHTPFEIVLDDERPTRVLAEYVDVCGGPGPARRLDPAIVTDAHNQIWDEYLTSRGSVHAWPRLVTGDAYLESATVLAPAGSRVCVIGGGSTGAWCVERAEANQSSVIVWASDRTLNGAFVSSRRNDALAQPPLTRTRVGGLHAVDGHLFPSGKQTRFVEGIQTTGVAGLPSGEVEVTFGVSAHPNAPPGRHVDANAASLIFPPAQETFDQVIVSIGQQSDIKDSQSWAAMLDPWLRAARYHGQHLIRDREGRVVGLHSSDERLRVLGAAALSHPDVAAEWARTRTPSNVFYRSLCEQARVGVGIALAAVTIGEANHYWSPPQPPNDNLNTVSDLRLNGRWTGQWGARPVPLFAEMASTWIEMRAARIPPFLKDEWLWMTAAGISADRY
jgi:hypothetical protein